MATEFNYKIYLTEEEFNEITKEKTVDKSRPNAFLIIGSWTKSIQNKISSIEGHPIELYSQSARARLNPNPKRGDANYFRANAKCKQCDVTYTMCIAKPPTYSSRIVIDINRSTNHIHEKKVTEKKIRGPKKIKIAEETVNESNGSAHDYQQNSIAEQNELVPSNDTIRKIVSDCINK
jgi:hypothetical protein